MAASAYAALVSLMHVLDNIQHPARQQLHFDRDQIETLRKRVGFLLAFLEDYSEMLCHAETGNLAMQMADVVDEAEEVIDYHVVDQLSQKSAYEIDTVVSAFGEDINKVLNKIESIEEKVTMVKAQERAVQEQSPRVYLPSTDSLAPPLSHKISGMVGFEEHLIRIMDQLTGYESTLQIVSIVGMGGIGKTTIAQNAFGHRCIVEHFDLCGWITVSHSYRIEDVLLGLLGELDNGKNKENDMTLGELRGEVHKMLFGRRYLIVLDDVWSDKVWDELRMIFPENRDRSRIIVTTRLVSVAASLGSQNPHVMDFLDEEKSWILFCTKAFGKKVCPNHELEIIGKSIVKCCKGLPLAIVVIGGLLRKSNMTREEWELVAKDVMKSFHNSKGGEDCSNILSLSYNRLPIHLKPCFLYMRVFPEGSEIDVKILIHFWIAEGFVKPKQGKTLQEIARGYLMDLIDRNMILIHFLYPHIGKILQCKAHDLLRDLCIREYEKEHSFRISKAHETYLGAKCVLCCSREASTSVNLPQVSTSTRLTTTMVSCFVCDFCNITYPRQDRTRLVKVAKDRFNGRDYLKPTRLRYLKISNHHKVASTSLPLLWNLQYLIIDEYITQLPIEIWEMLQLTHINVEYAFDVDPPTTPFGTKGCAILENLQTLRVVKNLGHSEGNVLKRIPNLKTLEIRHNNHSEEFVPLIHQLHNLDYLHKLEDFRCKGIDLEYISFPNSLKILGLRKCNCPWERMTTVGSLPNLELLRLECTTGGTEWNPVEGEFLRLKTLLIIDNDLVQWNAEKHHFPELETLELIFMECLEKIPSGIGDIEKLREIRLSYYSESVVRSAEELVEEQRSYGNEDLQLILT